MGGSRTFRRPLRGLIPRRRPEEAPDPERLVTGPARLGKKTKDLVKRLELGEVAVIDHADLDRIAAEDLATSGASAVINVASFSTGRYPNIGPLILARAGIVLVEAAGAPLFDLVDNGQILQIEGGDIRCRGEVIASGSRPTLDELEARLEELRTRIDQAIGDFALNTIEHVREESELLSGAIDLPETRTVFRDRHVLIVVRGPDYREDLNALNAYIRDRRPLIIAVDGGADAVLQQGMKPDVILGDMDSATDKALGCGAELIVHAYPDGRAPGQDLSLIHI